VVRDVVTELMPLANARKLRVSDQPAPGSARLRVEAVQD
jgi:hypothetical protein